MSLDDESVLAAFRDAARPEAPSPFHTAREHRNLEAILDAQARRHALWTPRRVVALALGAACAGASAAALALTLSASGDVSAVNAAALAAAPPVLVVPHSDVPSAVVAPAPAVAPVVAAPAAEVALAPVATRKLKAPVIAEAARTRTWRDEAAALVDSGDGVGAARVLVGALATDDGAGAVLALVARRFPDALDAVDADLAVLKSAEAMRVRCEQKLLRSRDRDAVEACRAFGLAHPEHPGARTLAFAAGRVAEDDVGDLALAEDAYSRALVLSPFIGMPGTDALFARARVRAGLGNLDEARGDLRLYLANEPAGRGTPAVAALATRLGL